MKLLIKILIISLIGQLYFIYVSDRQCQCNVQSTSKLWQHWSEVGKFPGYYKLNCRTCPTENKELFIANKLNSINAINFLKELIYRLHVNPAWLISNTRIPWLISDTRVP